MWKLGKESLKVYESGILPDWIRVINEACFTCPIEFTLTSGVRTTMEQFNLFRIGREHLDASKPIHDPDAWTLIPKGKSGYGKVTNCDGFKYKSNHQSGKAIDFQVYVKGRPDLSYDRIHMAVVIGSFITIGSMLHKRGEIEYKIRSGADWDGDTEYLEPGSFVDLPHLEFYTP